MSLDLAIVGCVLLLAVLGAFTGILRQLLNLAAVLVGWLAARSLGPSVATGFSKTIPALVAGPIATVLIFFAAAVLTGILGRFALRLGHRSGVVHGSLDRGLGALLGAATGAFGLWVVLSALTFVGERVSQFGAIARQHNLFEHLDAPAMRALKRLILAARDPLTAARLRTDADTQKLLSDPRIRALVNGPDAVAGRQGSERLSPEALRVLGDPAVVKQLEAILGKVPEVGP
jgi:uncharacterized membrane protein required for colicin V production